MTEPTNQIDTWAIVEIMGHTKLAGKVKTEPFGAVQMLRVDVPELPEVVTKQKQSWDDDVHYFATPKEVDVVQPAEAAYTRYFGLQAVFSLTPCDEVTVMAAMDRMRKSPAKILRAVPLLAAESPHVPSPEELDSVEESNYPPQPSLQETTVEIDVSNEPF